MSKNFEEKFKDMKELRDIREKVEPLASLSKDNNDQYFSYRYSISTPNLPAIKSYFHERDKDRLATTHHIEKALEIIHADVAKEIKLENRKARELVQTSTKPLEQTKQR